MTGPFTVRKVVRDSTGRFTVKSGWTANGPVNTPVCLPVHLPSFCLLSRLTGRCTVTFLAYRAEYRSIYRPCDSHRSIYRSIYRQCASHRSIYRSVYRKSTGRNTCERPRVNRPVKRLRMQIKPKTTANTPVCLPVHLPSTPIYGKPTGRFTVNRPVNRPVGKKTDDRSIYRKSTGRNTVGCK